MGAEGTAALANVLSQTQIKDRKCAALRDAPEIAIRPAIPLLTFFDTSGSPLRSLAGNQLCGVDGNGEGTFTLEGLTPLCEAFTKMPSLTSVRCAARECDTAHILTSCF